MEPLATADEMRAYDARAIRRYGVRGTMLMENAGRSVANAVERYLEGGRGKRVLVVCGKGNNGGDGFVAARHLLLNRHMEIDVGLVGSAKQVRGDARVNLNILRKLATTESRLTLFEIESLKSLKQLRRPDLIVDALFGTGFSGAVKNPYRQVIDWINANHVPVIAVDVPSGLNADNGTIENIGVSATRTVTMGMKKIGLVVGKGPEVAGEIEVEHLGAPDVIFSEESWKTFLVSTADVQKRLPRRPLDAHKHSVGKIFVLAGSKGLTGAAAMTSTAAMRAGAGAVVLGTPRSVYNILARKLTEVMTEPLDDTDQGTVGLKALETIQKYIDWSDVTIIGPGLGRHAETRSLLLTLLNNGRKPFLLDADGLNALAGNTNALRRKDRDIIITPHSGELARLIGRPAQQIDKDRVNVARTSAKELGVTVVLKGAPTVTGATGGIVCVNSTGNAGLATAGTGDVLAGIIGTFWAQKMPPFEAAYAGVFIHGLAGDFAKKHFGERSMMAMDVVDNISGALQHVESYR